MNPIPGMPISGPSDRLTDAQGDVAILTRSITVGGNSLNDVFALPPGFGISQQGPFATFVQNSADGGVVIAYGDNNAYGTGAYFGTFANVVAFVMTADCLTDYMQAEDGGQQDGLGFPLRFTQAGPSQTMDIEQWVDQSQAHTSGIDCNANLYATLYDVNQDVFPAAGSACLPREGMLGWDYDAHQLMAYGADNAWHAVGGPYG